MLRITNNAQSAAKTIRNNSKVQRLFIVGYKHTPKWATPDISGCDIV